MRELLGEDIFLISEILDKADITLPEMQGDEMKIGLAIGMEICRKLYKAKKEIRVLLQSVLEKTDEEMMKLTLKQTKNAIKEIVKNEDFKDFFKST